MWTKKDCMEAAARGEGCLGKARDDEPVFVLRGQDITMPRLIASWAILVKRENGGVDNDKTIEAMKFVGEIVDWQAAHYTKVPD